MNNVVNSLLKDLKTIWDAKIHSRETQFENDFIRLELIKYTKGNNPKEHQYYSVQRLRPVKTEAWKVREKVKDIVTTFTVTEDEKVILTNQFRFPHEKFIIENPAWLQDKDCESLEETARREILEETWYAPEKIIHLGKTPTSSWLTTETIDCFIWLNSKKVSDILNLDWSEDIQVIEVPLSDMDEFLAEAEKRRSGRF